MRNLRFNFIFLKNEADENTSTGLPIDLCGKALQSNRVGPLSHAGELSPTSRRTMDYDATLGASIRGARECIGAAIVGRTVFEALASISQKWA